MLDRAARSTVSDFSTLFLVCLAVLLPLELAYTTIHRDVVEVHDLAPFLEDVGERQRVGGVGPQELDDAERNRTVLNAIELALIPVFIAAGRRVFARRAEGELPTATDAYVHGLAPPRIGPLPRARSAGAILLALVFSLLVGYAAYRAGEIVAQLFPDRCRFVILGGVEAVSRSVGLPWLLGAWLTATAGERRAGRRLGGGPFAQPPKRSSRTSGRRSFK